MTLAAVRACGLMAPPPIPASELRPQRSAPQPASATPRAVRHHYDVSNEFFALFLDESMTYSCALFSRELDSLEGSWGTHPPSERRPPTLEQAQAAKRELICRKLALAGGRARARRRLRLGQLRDPCGEPTTACRRSASPSRRPQAELARERVAEAGPRAISVEIRVSDYRDLGATEAGRHSPSARIPVSASEHYDAIASIGMVEHVGANQIDLYARQLRRPAGTRRASAQPRHRPPAPRRAPTAGPFSERYVFPDAAPLHALARALSRSSGPASSTLHVEELCARTTPRR